MLDFLKNYELSYLLPKSFWKSINSEANTDSKFHLNNISTLFLDNAAMLMLISFVLPCGMVVILSLLRKCHFLSRKFAKIEKIFEHLDGLFIYNLLFLLFQNSTQEISFFIAFQMKNVDFSTTYSTFSFLVCLAYLLINIVMIIWMRNIIILINENERKVIPKEYECIFQNLNKEKKSAFYYPLVKSLRKFFLSFLIVFLYNDILAVSICLCVLCLIMYFYTRIFEPLDDKYKNMIAEITELLQCCLFLLLYLYKTCKMETSDSTALIIGYISIIILIVIIVLNFAMILISIMLLMYRYILSRIWTLDSTLKKELKVADYISKKIDLWNMEEYTYEKIIKNDKTGTQYIQTFSRKKVEKNSKSIQIEEQDLNLKLKKSEEKKYEKIEDIGKSRENQFDKKKTQMQGLNIEITQPIQNSNQNFKKSDGEILKDDSCHYFKKFDQSNEIINENSNNDFSISQRIDQKKEI